MVTFQALQTMILFGTFVVTLIGVIIAMNKKK